MKISLAILLSLTLPAVAPAAAQECDTLPLAAGIGAGTPGSTGVPELSALGQPMVSQPGMGVRIAHATPGASAQIVVGPKGPGAYVPGYGVRVFFTLPVLRIPVQIGLDGESPVLLAGPAPTSPALCGLEFVVQGIVADAVAPGGQAFTSGLHLRFGVGSAAASLYDGASFDTRPSPDWDNATVAAAGDLNGDGLADVVVPGSVGDEGSVSILLQLYEGSLWLAASQSTGGPWSTSLVVVDLDDDGLLDVALANHPADDDPPIGSVSLLRGRGDATFEAPVVLTSPPSGLPRDIVAADIDGDGLPELVVSGWTADSVAVFPNLGGMAFGSPGVHGLGGTPQERSLAVADLSGDGAPDIVILRREVALQDDDLILLPGLGGTSFGAAQNFPTGLSDTHDLASGDVDGDGDVDVVFSGIDPVTIDAQLWLMANLGSGQLAAPIGTDPSDTLNSSLATHLVDLDDDGLPELVAANGAFSWVQPNRGGSFGPATRVECHANSLEVADMDGDGRTDLLETHSFWVRWIRGLGGESFEYPNEMTTQQPVWTTAFDLDGDDIPDLQWDTGNASSSGFTLQHGLGDGSFGQPVQADYGGFSSRPPEAVDMDGDGDLDLVFANTIGPNAVVVVRNQGDGTMGAPDSYAAASLYSALPVDLDVDGDSDVVASRTAGGLYTLMGTGGGTLLPAQPLTLVMHRLIGVGDIDEDGAPDVVYGTPPLGSANTAEMRCILGMGDGSFGPPQLVMPMPGGSTVTNGLLVDVDLDGHLDIVLVSAVEHLRVYRGAGDGSFALSHEEIARFNWDLAVADVNVDGALDLVGSGSDGIAGVMLGFGDGTFAPLQPGVARGAIADFDQDGDLDIAGVGLVFLNKLE